MKKGYLYLVVADRRVDSTPDHYFKIGELAECVSGPTVNGWFDCYDSTGWAQFLRPEHVVEIGEI